MSSLSILGINDKEEQIYRILLVGGQLSIGEISFATKININDLTPHLDNLVKKKLIREIPGIQSRYACLLPVGPLKDELLQSVNQINVIGEELRKTKDTVLSSLKQEMNNEINNINAQISEQESSMKQTSANLNSNLDEKEEKANNDTNTAISQLDTNYSDLSSKFKEESILSANNQLDISKKNIFSAKTNVNSATTEILQNQEEIKNKSKSELSAPSLESVENSRTEIVGKLLAFKQSHKDAVEGLNTAYTQNIDLFQSQFTSQSNTLKEIETNLRAEYNELSSNFKAKHNEFLQNHTDTILQSKTELDNTKQGHLDNVNLIKGNLVQDFTTLSQNLDESITAFGKLNDDFTLQYNQDITNISSQSMNFLNTSSEDIVNQVNNISTNLKQDLTNEIARVQEMIQKQFEEFNTTFSEKMNNAVNNMQTNVNNEKQKIADEITNMSSQLTNLISENQQTRQTSYNQLVTQFKGNRDSEKEKISNSFDKVISDLDGIISTVSKKHDEISANYKSLNEQNNLSIDKITASHGELLNNKFLEVLDTITTSINDSVTKLKELNNNNTTQLKEKYETTNTELNTLLETTLTSVKQNISDLYQATLNNLNNALDEMHLKYTNYVDDLKKNMDTNIDQLSQNNLDLKNNLDATYSKSNELMNNEFKTFETRLQNTTSNLVSEIKSELSSFLAGINTEYSQILNNMKDLNNSGIDSKVSVMQKSFEEFQDKYTNSTNLVANKTTSLAEMLDNIFKVQEETKTTDIKTTHIVGKSAVLKTMSDILSRVKSKATILVPSLDMINDDKVLGMPSTAQVTLISFIDEGKDKNWINKMHGATANVNIRAIMQSGTVGQLPDFIGCEREGEEILLAAKDESTDDYIGITSLSSDFVKIFGNIVIADYARGKSKQIAK